MDFGVELLPFYEMESSKSPTGSFGSLQFNALWKTGTPARFIRFPREGHGIREPRHQRVRYGEQIAWKQKYVLVLDWVHKKREAGDTSTETLERDVFVGRFEWLAPVVVRGGRRL